MTQTHAKKVKGQLVQKTEWKERNGQTDKNDRFITAFLTVVGNCNERTNW